jgi:hypothetical protein
MLTELKIIRFRGALYRLATQVEVGDLKQKLEKMLDLVSFLGVRSAAEELTLKYYHPKNEPPPETPFLTLKDGRAFTELVYELANRAAETGYGETPAFFDQSAEEMQAGIQDALTGKLIPTLKQIRQLFDELKQHPGVLRPRDFSKAEPPKKSVAPKRVHVPSREDRELELKLQDKFLKERQREGAVLPSTIRFRGALYRRTEEKPPLSMVLKSLIIGDPGDKSNRYLRAVVRKLRESLLQFRTSLREDALVAVERYAQDLLLLSESIVSLLKKIMLEEHELRKDVAEGHLPEQEYQEGVRKKELVQTYRRLKKEGYIDDAYLHRRGYPPDFDPKTLNILQLEDLIANPLKKWDRRRRENLGLPQPKRKIWKDVPEPVVVPKPKPRGRRRLF